MPARPRPRFALALLPIFLVASESRAAYSPSTTNGWFIVVGRVVGFGGAQFRSDLWLFNPDAAQNAVVTLIFHPQVASGAAAPAPIQSTAITLAPRETKYLADVLLATVPADGQVGALEWSSNLPVMGGMRSYTAPSGCTGGTFGAFQPGIPTTESMDAMQSSADAVNVLQIFGTNSGDSNYRTQLDVTNTSTGTVEIEVKVIDPVTATVYGGVQTFSVAAKSLLRVGRILEAVGAPSIDGLRITVGIHEGTILSSGGILAVGSTLDNRSQDQYAFVGQRQSGPVVPAQMLPLETTP
ncbi:MAG TPA: hypothetical protein VKE50_11955 [Thermoanaerobaculia bacterium]|nr:hypothetical protein [Thermoanaerobaculia bacterium]